MPEDCLAPAVPCQLPVSSKWDAGELSHFLPIAYLRIRDLSLRRRYTGDRTPQMTRVLGKPQATDHGKPQATDHVPLCPIGSIANRRAREGLALYLGAGTPPCHDSAGHAAIRSSLRWRRTFAKSMKRRS